MDCPYRKWKWFDRRKGIDMFCLTHFPELEKSFVTETKKKFLLWPRSFQHLVLLYWFCLLYCRCYQHNWFLYRSSDMIVRSFGNSYGSHIYFRIFPPNQRHLIVWNTANNQWIEIVEVKGGGTDGTKPPGGYPLGEFRLSILFFLQQWQR